MSEAESRPERWGLSPAEEREIASIEARRGPLADDELPKLVFLIRSRDASSARQKDCFARMGADQRALREDEQRRQPSWDAATKARVRRQQRNENKALWMLRQATGRPCQGRSRESRSGPTRTRSRSRRPSTQRARSPGGDDPHHLVQLPIRRRTRGAT
jgi:hypothetical protein